MDIARRCELLLPRPRELTVIGGYAQDPCKTSHHQTSDLPPQGYRITISGTSIEILHSDPAGRFYAQQTLDQLHLLFGPHLPQIDIRDWPDYPNRGVMLDISRDKVPTMATLLMIIDELASLKINQLQLYTEHTFAYRDHEIVWKDASPMTTAEIVQLRAFCQERFIELVPNQNSFGHMERWLKHEKYRELAESPGGSIWPDGTRIEEPFSLCPTEPKSINFLDGLYRELLPNFTSNYFNVGCDETFDLGQTGTRSESICREKGKHVVYLDFLKKIHGLCNKYNKQMMFWGDIILEAPELIPQLPKDAIALEWGYEGNHPFNDRLAKLAQAGLRIYVCPGTSSWLTFAGRTQNAIDNLTNAAEAGLKNSAIGFLNTDWGDHGHMQYWPVSYYPIAYGAGVSWCLEANRNVEVAEPLNHFIFDDPTNHTAQLFRDLGNVYRSAKQLGNSTLLFRIIQQSGDRLIKSLENVDLPMLVEQRDRLREMSGQLNQFASHRVDHQLMIDELKNTINFMLYATYRGRWALGDPRVSLAKLRQSLNHLIIEHERLWKARNRVGGLRESVARLKKHFAEYP